MTIHRRDAESAERSAEKNGEKREKLWPKRPPRRGSTLFLVFSPVTRPWSGLSGCHDPS